jgi:tRNA/rRNA methyltransferase
LMSAVRHLLGRAQPTQGEVRMLHGLARQLLWIARRAGRSLPDPASSDEPPMTSLFHDFPPSSSPSSPSP